MEQSVAPIQPSDALEAAIEVRDAPLTIDQYLDGTHDTPELRAADAFSLLAYPDLTAEDHQAALAFLREAPGTVVYARELQQMVSEVGLEKVVDLAAHIRDVTVATTQALGIEPGKYTHELSWALWDMAKQRHWAKPENLAAAGEAYPYRDMVGDAVHDSHVREIIVSRQVGWEVDAFMRGFAARLYPIQGTPEYEDVQRIRREASRNGRQQELNSHALVEVGRACQAALAACLPEMELLYERSRPENTTHSSAPGPFYAKYAGQRIEGAPRFNEARYRAMRLAHEAAPQVASAKAELVAWRP